MLDLQGILKVLFFWVQTRGEFSKCKYESFKFDLGLLRVSQLMYCCFVLCFFIFSSIALSCGADDSIKSEAYLSCFSLNA